MVHSLEGMPEEHHRDYFIYLLDYGWKEPLSAALISNFGKMATLASEKKNAVVIMKTDAGVHFDDEVLSWHNINGDDAEREQLLPAMLITNRHPAEFRRRTLGQIQGDDLKMILIPLRKHCRDTSEVVHLIQRVFAQIKKGEDLDSFKVTNEKKRGLGGALASSIILEPNFAGVGFSFNKLRDYFKK